MYHYAPIVALPMGKLADIALWEWFGVYSRSFYSQSQITFNLSDSSKRQRWDGHWKCHRKLYGWLNQDVWYFSIWLGATGVISDAVRTGSKECFLLLTIDKPLRFLIDASNMKTLGKCVLPLLSICVDLFEWWETVDRARGLSKGRRLPRKGGFSKVGPTYKWQHP